MNSEDLKTFQTSLTRLERIKKESACWMVETSGDPVSKALEAIFDLADEIEAEIIGHIEEAVYEPELVVSRC